MKKKIAIVTGATGGVGCEFVKSLCEEELDEVWVIARNVTKLQELRKINPEKILCCPLDLSKLEDLNELAKQLDSKQPIVAYLINNAGIAKAGSYNDFSVEEIAATVDLNCKAPVILCRLCLPFMEAGSHILNISSASSFQPNPYINLYASTKVFERHYSRALNAELIGTGIIVTAVCPGWIDTELLSKEINGKPVEFPGIVPAERVVKQAMKDAKKGKDISVCSFYVKYLHFISKITPQKQIMKMWIKSIKKYM